MCSYGMKQGGKLGNIVQKLYKAGEKKLEFCRGQLGRSGHIQGEKNLGGFRTAGMGCCDILNGGKIITEGMEGL